MSEPAPAAEGGRPGIERAAIFLLSLGEKDAAEVLKQMSAKDVERVGAAMAKVANVTRAEVGEVIGKFTSAVETQTSLGVGSDEFVRRALVNALGQSKAATLIDRIPLTKPGKGIETLRWMEPRAIADMVRLEHPQIIAIVLAHLEADQAAGVIRELADELRSDVLLRIATLDGVQPAALEELDQIIERQFASASSSRNAVLGGPKLTAEIVNMLGPEIEGPVMSRIKEADAALGAKIEDLIFVFEDLEELDDRGMQELLRQIPSDGLMLALKATTQGLKDKIFKNMSQRAAETLKEDLQAKGPVKLSEVEFAKKEILTVVRKLSEEGSISLGGRGGDSYV